MEGLSKAAYDRVIDKVAGTAMLNRPFSARREDLTVADHIRLAANTDGRVTMFTTTFSWKYSDLPTLAIYNAAMKCVVSGNKPVSLTVSMVFPERFKEREMKRYVANVFICSRIKDLPLMDVQVHRAKVDKPIVTATVGGQIVQKETEYPDTTYSIVAVGTPGDAGTLMLREEYNEKLQETYPEHFLDTEKLLKELEEMIPAIGSCFKYGVACEEGGIFAGLEKLSDKTHLGFTVDLQAIQLHQLTVEISEEMDINPYKLVSAGLMLLVTDKPEDAVAVCTEAGLKAQVIGVLNKTNDKIVQNSYENRFLDAFRSDSITEVNYES